LLAFLQEHCGGLAFFFLCLFHKFQRVKPKPLPVVGRPHNVNSPDRHILQGVCP
jgi:hypothetical protein